MSKARILQDPEARNFTELLSAIKPGDLSSTHKSGSARIQSGLQAMRDQARAEGLETGRREGYEAGFAEGTAAGNLAVEAARGHEVAVFSQAMSDFVSRAQNAVDAWYAAAEERLATLAVEIARRALAGELSATRDSVLAIVREALDEVRDGSTVRVFVNPMDHGLLESHQAEIVASLANVNGITVVSDPLIDAGCRLETEFGVVDARVESYLSRLEKEAA